MFVSVIREPLRQEMPHRQHVGLPLQVEQIRTKMNLVLHGNAGQIGYRGQNIRLTAGFGDDCGMSHSRSMQDKGNIEHIRVLYSCPISPSIAFRSFLLSE